MVKIYTFSKTRVSLAPIDVTPNYRPSSCNSSLRQLVPALLNILEFFMGGPQNTLDDAGCMERYKHDCGTAT